MELKIQELVSLDPISDSILPLVGSQKHTESYSCGLSGCLNQLQVQPASTAGTVVVEGKVPAAPGGCTLAPE